MAENYSIALGVKAPEPSGLAAINPLDLANQLIGIQRNNIALQNDQQVLGARQRAGEIMNAAPSFNEGIQAIAKDPQVSSYLPDYIATLQGANASMTAMQGAQQDQTFSARDKMLQILGSGMQDPRTLSRMMHSALDSMSPAARKGNEKFMQAIFDSVGQGLDDANLTPAERGQLYQQRLSSIMLGSGLGETAFATRGVTPPSQTLVPGVGPGGTAATVHFGGLPELGGGQPYVMGEKGAPTPGEIDKQTGGVTPPVRGLSPGQQAQQAADVKYGEELTRQAQNDIDIYPDLHKLDVIDQALSNFQAGGGADVRAELGKTLQGLKNAGIPVPDSVINKVANMKPGEEDKNSLAATQIFKSLAAPLALRSMTGDIQGQARLPEIEAYKDMLSETNDPETLRTLLGTARQMIQYRYDRAKSVGEFRRKLSKGDPSVEGMTMMDYPEWRAENFSGELPDLTAGGLVMAKKKSEAPEDKGAAQYESSTTSKEPPAKEETTKKEKGKMSEKEKKSKLDSIWGQ